MRDRFPPVSASRPVTDEGVDLRRHEADQKRRNHKQERRNKKRVPRNKI